MRLSRHLLVATLALSLGGCGGRVPGPTYTKATRSIPALARHPYRLYAIEEPTGAVWRIGLDGVRRELLVSGEVFKRSETGPSPRLESSVSRTGSSRPDATVALASAFEGRGSIALQIEHEAQRVNDVRPIWEELRIDPKPKPPPPPAPGIPVPSFAHDPFAFESPWAIRYSSKVSPSGDREVTHISEIRLFHRDGRIRSHRFAADPVSMVRVLAIFEMRYLILFDNPNLLLWDLETDKKRLILRASDVAVAWFDPALNTQPPRAHVRLGSDDFQWDLRSPDDLAIQPQHLVRKPVQ